MDGGESVAVHMTALKQSDVTFVLIVTLNFQLCAVMAKGYYAVLRGREPGVYTSICQRKHRCAVTVVAYTSTGQHVIRHEVLVY